MADKTKTIKGSTDNELDELIRRLRKENEVQSLISDIKRKSASGYTPYDQGQEISTEKPIDDLYHFGVPGMKWGVRKSRSSITVSADGKHRNQEGKEVSEDHVKKIKLKTKSVAELSDAELKSLNTRMQMEKSYKELSKTEMSAGRKFVSDVLGSAGRQVATQYTTKLMTAAIEAMIKSAGKK